MWRLAVQSISVMIKVTLTKRLGVPSLRGIRGWTLFSRFTHDVINDIRSYWNERSSIRVPSSGRDACHVPAEDRTRTAYQRNRRPQTSNSSFQPLHRWFLLYIKKFLFCLFFYLFLFSFLQGTWIKNGQQ